MHAVSFTCFKVKYIIIDTFQRSTNETIIIYWYLDIDFNLEMCSIIVFLEV